MTQNLWNFSKKFMVSIDFSTQISINSLASGGFAPEPTTNAYFQIFQIFIHIFANFLKIFTKFFEYFLKIFLKKCFPPSEKKSWQRPWFICIIMGASRGGKLPPSGNRKNCCRKWCYFQEQYKMTEVWEEGIENGFSKNYEKLAKFPLELSNNYRFPLIFLVGFP